MASILVVGFSEVDSGKTVLASSLVTMLRRRGYDAVAVKPLAAANIWEYPWLIDEIRSWRLAVTGDALRLSRASEGAVELEVLNPLSALYAPLDPSRSQWRLKPGREESVVLGRVSRCYGDRVDSLHYVNVDALSRIPVGIASPLIDIAGTLHPPPLRVNDEFVERVVSGGFTSEVESCMQRVLSRHELVVYESNSDVAAPTPSSLESELVLVAGRGVVAVVSGKRWAKAVEILLGSGGLKSILARDVLALTGVEQTLYLPFLAEPIEGYSEQDLEGLLSIIIERLES